MFIDKNKIHEKYDVDFLTGDISVHSGIPKQFYALKDKKWDDWEIPPWELYIFESRLIGFGTFAKVYLAKWRETFVVAKVIDEQLIENKKHLVLREIDIMSKLHHPNVVQFLGYIDTPVVIVMEYIPNQNLKDKIPQLWKKEKIRIMMNILQGLAYIHNRKPHSLIHRDIKPTNILLTNSKVAKIADFGLSKFYSIEKNFSTNDLTRIETNSLNTKNKYIELTDNVGTDRYMAPETKKDNTKYTNKVDIYSTGILLYEMFENKSYIPGLDFNWFWCPKKIKSIITKRMLCENPNDRWDAVTILKTLNRIY